MTISSATSKVLLQHSKIYCSALRIQTFDTTEQFEILTPRQNWLHTLKSSSTIALHSPNSQIHSHSRCKPKDTTAKKSMSIYSARTKPLFQAFTISCSASRIQTPHIIGNFQFITSIPIRLRTLKTTIRTIYQSPNHQINIVNRNGEREIEIHLIQH